MDAEDEVIPAEHGKARDPELARQVRAWCAEEYQPKRGRYHAENSLTHI
jgi:hypothetical protein